MKRKTLRFGEGFRVALSNRGCQAAEMVIEPGKAEGGPTTWHRTPANVNLVSMTRSSKSNTTPAKGRRPPAPRAARADYWLLQDAKARFSELVRKVRSDGPQHVTVHGREEVVVISAEEFRRLKGDITGDALIAAMQASPHRNVSIEPKRAPMPVRDISL